MKSSQSISFRSGFSKIAVKVLRCFLPICINYSTKFWYYNQLITGSLFVVLKTVRLSSISCTFVRYKMKPLSLQCKWIKAYTVQLGQGTGTIPLALTRHFAQPNTHISVYKHSTTAPKAGYYYLIEVSEFNLLFPNPVFQEVIS
jgi:hypothetical protein